MLSDMARNITPSATTELDGRVNDMIASGMDVIKLNVGEPDFPTPENICDACKRALDEGRTKYVNVSGIPELKEAVCEKLKRDNGLIYRPEQICISTGAKQAINNAVLAAVNPGDEVIIPMPCWVSYVEIVKMAGGVPVCAGCADDMQLNIKAIENALTLKSRAVLINTPNNPTGAVYTRETLERLASLAVEHDLCIISDEVYEKLTYNGVKHVCVAALSEEAYEHTILINGFSKAYAMTGWRCGYTAAPEEYASGIRAIQSHSTSNSTTMVQWAALEALRSNEDTVRAMVEEFSRRKDYVYKRLTAMPGIICNDADGAFYLLPDVSAHFDKKDAGQPIADSFGFCDYILREANVAIVPGDAFFAPGHVRISYANSMENLKEAMDRFEAALNKLDQ